MRILVISDSHRRTNVIDEIIAKHDDIKHIFFLGDNASDIEDFEFIYPDRIFHSVCGNCDYASFLPTVGLEVIEGKRIFYTHGHTYSVKYGLSKLKEIANQNNYDIVLFGHTHVSQTVYEDGRYYVNPGSCAKGRDGSRNSYAIIDVTENGILPNIIEI